MSPIRIRREEGIVTLTLDRAPVNILDVSMMWELAGAVADLAPDDRAIVLQGEGKHFCAGADVKDHLPDQGEKMLRALGDLFSEMSDIPIPTIAIVRGACLGAGLELAAACDLVFAAANAKIGVPEVALGVIPPLAAIDLPAIVGPARAADLILSGRQIDGTEAARYGLVLEAVPEPELDERAHSWIRKLSGLSVSALRACKEALRKRTYGEALQVYRESVLHSKDGIEGLNAFLEKRKPVWTNP